jgi:hypothetical protein
MESLAQTHSRSERLILQSLHSVWEALVSDDPVNHIYVERCIRGIVFDSIQRARVRHNIFLSDRNLQLLLDGAREEAIKHEHVARLQVQLPPKRWFESAGLRGAGMAFVANLAALLLILFMPLGQVRDAVTASCMVFGVLGAAVAWIGRRRATRRIA